MFYLIGLSINRLFLSKYKLGEELYKKEHFEEAIIMYDMIIKFNPQEG